MVCLESSHISFCKRLEKDRINSIRRHVNNARGTCYGEMCPPRSPKEKIRNAYTQLVLEKKAIMVFEDDAALVASSPSLFASEMRTLLATLPPNWDLLDLDPHPDFCDGSLWRQPKRRVVSDSAMSSLSSSSVKVYQTYTTFARTAATVVSWNGAMKLLRRLPADVAVDTFIAKIMRQGALNVFVACDNNVIRQQISTWMR